MSNPSHRAYVVSTPKKPGEKGFFREVGAVWPHSKGGGFDVVIYDGISISGRVVCTPAKPKEEETEG